MITRGALPSLHCVRTVALSLNSCYCYTELPKFSIQYVRYYTCTCVMSFSAVLWFFIRNLGVGFIQSEVFRNSMLSGFEPILLELLNTLFNSLKLASDISVKPQVWRKCWSRHQFRNCTGVHRRVSTFLPRLWTNFQGCSSNLSRLKSSSQL